MGYPFGKKGYRVMELETSKFYEPRDDVFPETIFPFAVFANNRAHCPILNPVQHMSAVDDEVKDTITNDFDTVSVRHDLTESFPGPRRSIREEQT